MSASDAAPLPRLGEVFFDVRGSSRSMRLSWYADTGVAVFSIWQGGMCTGTFRLPIGDLPRMVETLSGGPGARVIARAQAGEPREAEEPWGAAEPEQFETRRSRHAADDRDPRVPDVYQQEYPQGRPDDDYRDEDYHRAVPAADYDTSGPAAGYHGAGSDAGYRGSELDPDYRGSELDPDYRRSELDPDYRRSELDPDYRRSELDPDYRRSELDPDYRGSGRRPGNPAGRTHSGYQDRPAAAYPDGPAYPGIPAYPDGGPARPDTSAYPDGGPAYPDTSAYPDVPAYPHAAAAPDRAAYPDGTAYSDGGAHPDETAYPDSPAHREGASSLDFPSVPSGRGSRHARGTRPDDSGAEVRDKGLDVAGPYPDVPSDESFPYGLPPGIAAARHEPGDARSPLS